ncbi:MAG: hypothetical protein V1913_06800 [Fibrobacterota bacterium]
MKKALALFLALSLLFAATVSATNARVESMGKSATYFMDDVSIYDNPANINIYPNFLIGEPGHMTVYQDSGTGFKNEDPAEPYGGGILSFSLNRDKNAETRYPMVTVGAMLNHKNELVDVLMAAARANGHIIPRPVVPNSDFFLGYTLPNGTMLGGHLYAARQNVSVKGMNMSESFSDLQSAGITTGNNDTDRVIDSLAAWYGETEFQWTSQIVRGDIGVNMPLTQNVDMELSGGLALLQYSGPDFGTLDVRRYYTIPSYDANDFSWFLNARFFATLVGLNGELVPVFKYKNISVRDYNVNEFEGGLGANVTLDRGFFWIGSSFIYNGTEAPVAGLTNQTRSTTSISIPLSFGIERNVVWEWLVLRVGFRKVIYGTTTNQAEMSSLYSNPEADMTVSDHVGGGIGINLEEKLKIDAVLAEDILYKWGNLVSGNSHHILTRISATYSF